MRLIKQSSIKSGKGRLARTAAPVSATQEKQPSLSGLTSRAMMAPSTLRPYDILTLQQTIGNAACQRMLCSSAYNGNIQTNPGIIQRKINDGHDLTSPRFAGDPTLEDCYDDQARLTIGALGPSVIKIQQALSDLGYDLGLSGVDGKYGNNTWNAVKQFKTNEHLGWEHMGDVGPGTMDRLNTLFPAITHSSPPPVVEEDNPSCPVTDDLVTALEAKPALAQALIETYTAPDLAAPVALSTGGAGASSAVTATPGGIAGAVSRFKKLVNAKNATTGTDEPVNISNWGQFFWTGQLDSTIKAEINRLRSCDADAVTFANKADIARDAILNRDSSLNAKLAELDRLAANTTSSEKNSMLRLLRAASTGGGAIDTELWAAFNLRPDDSIPTALVTKYRSLRAMRTLLAYNSGACGTHAGRIAARLKRKGGIVAPGGKPAPFSARLSTGAGIRDRRPMGSPTSTFEPAASAAVTSSDYMLGDHIFQNGPLSATAKMQAALASGLLVHARVLSGVGYGGYVGGPDPAAKPIRLGAPPEEHSLLIIGYDASTFVFHDPDASVSHTPDQGFGMLYYDLNDDRLSTASNPADMPVNEDGKHHRGDKRYQIISLGTL